ncbi:MULTISPECIES: tyrosine-type recombinase/integrase [unclassified Gilliamella]|uniref:tyrosine-type recombinase/integrase n=1 Tax=unclassified Gilliamella TaxID=2685620 RepID=UPI0022697ECD|nr:MULTISPECIES: tyrosine-type recombinase/integrase [unclassified Gilliamella]MCX8587583.1 tyrosine-type recombinase/integrase [Gilliamella sp. B3801]MCX8591805.1 tyrosine-type recombinase/integrase [Gilliamella sp. B3804]
MFFLSKLFKPQNTHPKSVNNWLDEYITILAERNLKPKTIEIKTYLLKVIRQQIGDNPLSQITPPDISKIIKIYTDQDKAPSAKCMYHLIKDIFREAYAQGWNDRNPAEPIKCPKVVVKRSRMTLGEFKKILSEAEKTGNKIMHDAMTLALVTGQRRSDIAEMKKSNVKRNYLLVDQYKTGAKIALPIKLECKKIGTSLRDIIESADNDFLVSRNNEKIKLDDITRQFSRLRDRVFNRDYWTGTPTTFHEIRSLSERLYREQRIDTMTLLGHKSQQMTDKYNDSRGREYKKLRIN